MTLPFARAAAWAALLAGCVGETQAQRMPPGVGAAIEQDRSARIAEIEQMRAACRAGCSAGQVASWANRLAVEFQPGGLVRRGDIDGAAHVRELLAAVEPGLEAQPQVPAMQADALAEVGRVLIVAGRAREGAALFLRSMRIYPNVSAFESLMDTEVAQGRADGAELCARMRGATPPGDQMRVVSTCCRSPAPATLVWPTAADCARFREGPGLPRDYAGPLQPPPPPTPPPARPRDVGQRPACGAARCSPAQICIPGGRSMNGVGAVIDLPPSHCVALPAACGGVPSCACLGHLCPIGACHDIEEGMLVCVSG